MIVIVVVVLQEFYLLVFLFVSGKDFPVFDFEKHNFSADLTTFDKDQSLSRLNILR